MVFLTFYGQFPFTYRDPSLNSFRFCAEKKDFVTKDDPLTKSPLVISVNLSEFCLFYNGDDFNFK